MGKRECKLIDLINSGCLLCYRNFSEGDVNINTSFELNDICILYPEGDFENNSIKYKSFFVSKQTPFGPDLYMCYLDMTFNTIFLYFITVLDYPILVGYEWDDDNLNIHQRYDDGEDTYNIIKTKQIFNIFKKAILGEISNAQMDNLCDDILNSF